MDKKYKTLLVKQANESVTIEKLVLPIIRRAGYNTEDLTNVEEEYLIKDDASFILVDRMLKNSKGNAMCSIQVKKVGNTYPLRKDIEKTIPLANRAGILHNVFCDGIEWRIFEGTKQTKAINLLTQNAESKEESLVNYFASLRRT